jgi:K+-sensing histidine kinase KdpD
MKTASKKDLERENSLLKLLLSTVTHDVVGPLGFTANVLQASSKSPQAELLQELAVSLRASYDKSSEILCFLRNAWSKNIFEIEAVDIKKMVNDVLQGVRVRYPHAVFDYEEEDIIVNTSSVAISTAMENIFTNAAKYTATGDVISISVSYNDTFTSIYTKAPCTQEACISVIEILNNLETLKRDSRTSIGLQISRTLLDMCGARLAFSYEDSSFTSRIDIPR